MGRCGSLRDSAALFLCLLGWDRGFRDLDGKMAAPTDCLVSLEGEGSAESRTSGAEVAFPSDPAAPAPLCPHGGSASAPSLIG